MNYSLLLPLIVLITSREGFEILFQTVQPSQFSCLKNLGSKFFIQRTIDDPVSLINSSTTLKTARQFGLDTDLSFTPNLQHNGSVVTQINNVLSYIPPNLYGMVWLYVQGKSWGNYDQNINCQTIKSILQAIKARGKKSGIYTSLQDWNKYLGNRCDVSKQPLWYDFQSNDHTFADFIPFGGWTKPSQKRYKNAGALCYTLDINYVYADDHL